MNINKVETNLAGKTLSLETGKLAKQANSVVATLGETVVLATAVIAKEPTDCDWLPLKVDYDEKYYAAGVIRHSPYMKRETRPSETATLTGRFIDRSIRPLFPKHFHNAMQLILTVLSYDKVNSPDIVASIAGNAALAISEAPFRGPVGMCRVGLEDDKYVLNPNHESIREDSCPLSLIVSSVKDRIIMMEAGCNELDEKTMSGAIKFGNEANQSIIKLINDLVAKVGKPKIVVETPKKDQELLDKVASLAYPKLDPIFGQMAKIERDEFINAKKLEVCEELTSSIEDESEKAEKSKEISDYFDLASKMLLRKNILENGKRVGGRGIAQIRPLYIEVGLLPRTHGSSLFQRGETQALGTVTLGGPRNCLNLESMEGEGTKKYFHHYNFPPFSVGDISNRRMTGNRELGHGALAERALRPVLPEGENFPYSIRTVSEILESNGSSSMASTCCCSLSLMDAGVPIKKAVSGIAMGLIVDPELDEQNRNYTVITDLADLEDFGGFMDFKVTGTSDGITALQVDMKLEGIPMSVVDDTLAKAYTGRLEILKKMSETIAEPRENLSQYAPNISNMKIDPEKIKIVIGKGGETINKIIKETGVEINIDDEGNIAITSEDQASADEAIKTIELLTKDVKIGEVYEGKVTRILDFGAIVQLLPGKDGLCHISELAKERVRKVEDICKVGDTLKVKVIDITPQGKTSLSHKITM